MKFTLYLNGKTEAGYLERGILEYSDRIRHFVPFEIRELTAVKNAAKLPASNLLAKEEEIITKTVSGTDLVVLLDEKGKQFSSREFADWLERLMHSSGKDVSFLVGGAYGFSKSMKKKADHMISLSSMTFTHQMVRLFFLEQFYRALTIIRGMKYHND